MRDEAVGELVGTLCDRYGVNADDDMVTLWWNTFHETRQDVIDAALAAYLENEQFMPKIAKFREYVSMESRKANRAAGPNRCGSCEGSGWIDGPDQIGVTFPEKVYETVQPCPDCNQTAVHQKATVWDREKSPHQKARENDELYPSNPVKGIARVRKAYAEAIAKNAGDL